MYKHTIVISMRYNMTIGYETDLQNYIVFFNIERVKRWKLVNIGNGELMIATPRFQGKYPKQVKS